MEGGGCGADRLGKEIYTKRSVRHPAEPPARRTGTTAETRGRVIDEGKHVIVSFRRPAY